MTKICQITGKGPMAGNNVSHANNKTRRRFMPNIKKRKFWIDSEKRFVTLKLCTKGLRLIDKYGIEKVLKTLKDKK